MGDHDDISQYDDDESMAGEDKSMGEGESMREGESMGEGESMAGDDDDDDIFYEARESPYEDDDDDSVLPQSTIFSNHETRSLQSSIIHAMDDDSEDDDFGEVPPLESYEDMLQYLGKVWIETTVRHNVSIEGASHLWRLAFKFMGKILNKKEADGDTRKLPQFKHLRRKIMNKCVPPVKIRMAYLNLETGMEEHPPPSEIGPHKAYSDVTKYEKLYEISSVSIRDVLRIHEISCPNHQDFNHNKVELNLSCDGVADSNSSNVSLDVFSISFPECSTIYPITTIRPTKKSSVDFLAELTIILNEFREANVKILNVSADKPMRSLMKNVKGHSSYHGCEYCRSCAEYYQDPVTKAKIQRQLDKALKTKDNLQIEISRIQNKGGSVLQKRNYLQQIRTLRKKVKQEDLDISDLRKKLNKKVSYNCDTS